MPSIGKSWLRKEIVASWLEIIVVLIFSFGYFEWTSNKIYFDKPIPHFFRTSSWDFRLLLTMSIESTILAVLLLYLYWRGWKAADFKIVIDW